MAQPPTPSEIQKIQAALSSGKIEAIKLCREFTGMDLAEAKAYVENLPSASLDKPGDVAGKLPGGEADPVTAAIFSGNTIQAIKLFREMHHGVGLADAKQMVEKMAAELYSKHPEQFTRPPNSAGCTSVFGFLLPMLVWYLAAR